MQVVCPKCDGERIHGRRKRTCQECSGLGYVTADNVERLNVITSLDTTVDAVLAEAIGKLDSVVLIGYDKDGNEYFKSSMADGPKANWLIDRIKVRLMKVGD